MNSAIVKNGTNVVWNIIVSDPVDPCPFADSYMVGLLDGQECDIGWIYDQSTNTFSPPSP